MLGHLTQRHLCKELYSGEKSHFLANLQTNKKSCEREQRVPKFQLSKSFSLSISLSRFLPLCVCLCMLCVCVSVYVCMSVCLCVYVCYSVKFTPNSLWHTIRIYCSRNTCWAISHSFAQQVLTEYFLYKKHYSRHSDNM